MNKVILSSIAALLICSTGCNNEPPKQVAVETPKATKDAFSLSNAIESTKSQPTAPAFAKLECNAFAAVAGSCKGQTIEVSNVMVYKLGTDRDLNGYFSAMIATPHSRNVTALALFKSTDVSVVNQAIIGDKAIALKGVSLGRSPNGEALLKVLEVIQAPAK